MEPSFDRTEWLIVQLSRHLLKLWDSHNGCKSSENDKEYWKEIVDLFEELEEFLDDLDLDRCDEVVQTEAATAILYLKALESAAREGLCD